jgi:hypothetical protein
MIERWEILPDPHERFPNRYRVNVAAEEGDLRPLPDLFPKKVGKVWSPRAGDYRFSFYFYEPTREERDALARFLSGEPSYRPAVSGGRIDPSSEPQVEVISTGRSEHPSPVPPSAGAPLVESASDALQDWMGGAPSFPSPRQEVQAAGSEIPLPAEPAPSPEEPPEIVSRTEAAVPEERLILSNEPAPPIPSGHLYLRLGYFVPYDIPQIADDIQGVLVQTLESRKMPFVFHKVFSYPYQWPDRPLVDQVIEACRSQKADALICVGEPRRLELMMERCAEEGIKHYPLSREDARKRYWRLGLITRIVVKEE